MVRTYVRKTERQAFQLACNNGKFHTFSTEKEMAGIDWMKGFLKRHPDLSLRKPEPTSAARAMGFNRVAVASFFELLGGVMDKYNFTADKIYNCDETGVSSVSKSKSKVISSRGKRQVGSLSSAERGRTITVEICFNAAGTYMPPMLIYPRKRMNPQLLNGAFPGTWAECHKTGWMQSNIFVNWFKKFIEFSHASRDNPVLLLLDGHATHTKNLELIDLARANGVILLCYPPHCTHRLQALDVAFMKPLSTYYDVEVSNWLRSNPGRVVTSFQVAHLFGNAFMNAARITTASNGFKRTGVWPYNQNIFTDADFIAAETTNRPISPAPDTTNMLAPPAAETTNLIPPLAADTTNIIHPPTADTTNILVPLAADINKLAPTTSRSVSPTNQTEEVVDSKGNDLKTPPSPATPGCSFWNKSNYSEKSPFTVSPEQILPVPHLGKTNIKRTARKRGKTAILTESPYKTELQEQQEKNKPKIVKRTAFKVVKLQKPKQKLKKFSSPSDEDEEYAGRVQKQKFESKIVKKRTISKVQKVQKTKRKKKDSSSSSPEDEEDAQCLYCGYLYSQSEEGWVQCIVCRNWAHCSCAGEDDEDAEVNHVCAKCQ